MSDLSTDMLTSSTFSRFLDEEGLETLATRIDQVFARKGEGGSKLEHATYEDSPTLYPHDVNDLIKYNGIYYKVKVAMPNAGVALVVGTNIELANLPAGTGVFLDNIPGSGGGGGGGDASVVKVRYEVSPTENEHALNELIYYNSKVYKCTVAMPDPGVTLVVGTNIEVPTLSSTTIVMADGLPGTGMDAADVSYSDSDVDTALTELNSNLDRIGTIYSNVIPAGTNTDLNTPLNNLPAGTYVVVAETGSSSSEMAPIIALDDGAYGTIYNSVDVKGYKLQISGIISLASAGTIRFCYTGGGNITTTSTGNITAIRIS